MESNRFLDDLVSSIPGILFTNQLHLKGSGFFTWAVAICFYLIVKLRECHYSVDLAGWVRYYFYFHKLMGYVLASFLIAGLGD
jgi:hypothetical protein